MNKKKSTLWTSHALQRALEYKANFGELMQAWRRATDYQLPRGQMAYKFRRYGMKIMDTLYRYDYQTDLLFTYENKPTHTLIITVTRKSVANGE